MIVPQPAAYSSTPHALTHGSVGPLQGAPSERQPPFVHAKNSLAVVHIAASITLHDALASIASSSVASLSLALASARGASRPPHATSAAMRTSASGNPRVKFTPIAYGHVDAESTPKSSAARRVARVIVREPLGWIDQPGGKSSPRESRVFASWNARHDACSTSAHGANGGDGFGALVGCDGLRGGVR